MRKSCEFRGGAGLEEKFRPPAPCLGEFEVRPQNVWIQKFCDACAPFAYRWHQARPGSCHRCGKDLPIPLPVSKDGRIFKNCPECRGKKRVRSAAERAADPEARRKAVKKSRDKHKVETNKRRRDRAKHMRDLADVGKKLAAGEVVTVGDRVLRPKGGRPAAIEKAARVAQLANERIEWQGIQKQIAAEFHENTTVDALQALLRRHLHRQS
jgi:uncharacterized Zn finger protein (UPF0148 family)